MLATPQVHLGILPMICIRGTAEANSNTHKENAFLVIQELDRGSQATRIHVVPCGTRSHTSK